jgi:hypothetical protein
MMADISPLGVQDFGNLLTSFGQGVANTNQANAAAGQAQAQTGLINQQTQAAAMQNQIAKARQAIVLKALQDYNPQADDSAASPTPGAGGNGSGLQATPGNTGKAVPNSTSNPQAGSSVPNQPAQDATADNWYDPAQVDGGLRSKYFVNPAGTPQEIQALSKAAFIDPDGKLGLLEQAKMNRQNGVDSRLASAQNDASGLYETMTRGVVNAPAGRALDALEAISPQAAAQIRKLIPDDVEEDEAARTFGSHVANTVHQYSGRPVVADASGQYRDQVTGNPLTGAPKVGMNADQLAQLAAKGNELVTVKNSDGSESQIPRFQAEKSPSLQGWMTKIADTRGKIPGASPSVTGVPKAQFRAAVQDAASKAPPPAAPGPQTGAPSGQSAAPGPQTGAATQGAQAPQAPAPGGPMAIALQDKSYRSQIANQPVTSGTSQSKMAQGDTDNYIKQKADLQTAASDNAQASSQSLASFRAAKAIMDAPDGSNIAGVLPGALAQELAKLGFNTDTGAHRIEVAKYLTNGALQNLKTVYGAKPGVFDVKVNLDQAFPNIATMNDQSVKELIASQIRNASYIRDSARRVPMYLAAKNEPTSFNDWNEKYFTRSNAVNEPAGQEQNQTKQPVRPGQASSGTPTYANPAAVKADFQAGKITRAQATQILQQQHGMQ